MNASINNAQLATNTREDPRWLAVLSRDIRVDGSFYYSVQTTGVYCRPSCASRHARPEHVRFHATCADAEQAGFRPCLRCKPNQPTLAEHYANKVTTACRLIESAEVTPKLAELADQVGISSYHFHRIFKTITGVTPKQYANAQRNKRVQEQLARQATVTEAIFDAGYNANSRFYEQADAVLGMTPSVYRAGGANTEIRFAIGDCSLGNILVAQSERGVCAILLGDDVSQLANDLQQRFPKANLISGESAFDQLVATVIRFVETPRLGLNLPLDIRGTAFQQRVWQILRDIPVGTTASYSDIAHRLGEPKAVRAVAKACAANNLAIAIPCHRVVRIDGGLAGYRWGVERKRELLARELAPTL